jgi:superfamily I DNA/RNA helicase
MTPTPQQQAIYDAITGDSGHVVIEALAGSGKTTTAVSCAFRANGHKVGLLAFNRHIARELTSRLAGQARACTLHSLGFAAVRRAHPNVQVDEQKPRQLLATLRPEWCWRGPRGGLRFREEGAAALHLARLVKYSLANERDPEALAALGLHYGVDLPEAAEPRAEVYAAVATLIEAMARDCRQIDYDDQVWLPVRLGLPVEHFDLLMVDEVQDLNRCQQALARVAAGDGRLVPIGDRFQSLYGFAGADPDSIPRLVGELESSSRGCLPRPLTVTFRCPVRHVELARHLVPAIEPAPGAAEGEVLTLGPGESLRPHLRPGDLVVSRRNAPLLSLAFSLISAKVPVLVRGRDIGAGLLDLVDTLKPDDVRHLLEELPLYRDRQAERLEKRDAPESAFQLLEDRVTCLKELAVQCATVRQLTDTVRDLFSDTSDDGKVILSSIHRAKGLEADRVAIIDTDNLPMTRACRGCRGLGCPRCGQRGTRSQPWEVQQEYNLAYVAVTRAKKELIFAGPVPAIFGGVLE